MPCEMNPVERVRRAIAGEMPDRVPVVPLIIHHTMRLAGVRYDQYAQDPRLLVDTQVRAWQTYGYDGFHVTCDNWILPSALGCPIRFFPDQPPTAAARILMATTGAAGLEVDYQHDIAYYRQRTGGRVCLQGNIEPSGVLFRGTTQQVREACRKAIEQGKPGSRFILSSGCEVPRDTPVANLRAMIQTAQEFGRYEHG